MALILVDKREDAMERKTNSNKESPVSHLESVFDANNRLHSDKPKASGGGVLSFMMRQISVGDYIIILRGDEQRPNRLAAVIERKTWKDLGSSIPTGHVDNQTKKMKDLQQKTGCLLYFIVEGPLTYDDTTKIGGKHGLKFSQIHAKARHNMHRGIPFIQTKDPRHTVIMLTKFARDFMMLEARGELEFKCFRDFTDLKNLVSQDGDASQTVQAGAVQAGAGATQDSELENFESLLNETAKKSTSDMVMDIWTAIPGVTFNSAPTLIANFHIRDLFGASQEELTTLKDKMAALTYPGGNKIGKQAEKIIDNFRTPENFNATAIKCIGAVKGMGSAATPIVQNINIRDLCKDRVPIDELADIQIGKTRLGNVKAERLSELFNKAS